MSELAAILEDDERFRQVTMKTFAEDDSDGSGALDVSEMHKLMQKVARCTGAVEPMVDEVRATWVETDTNQDGTISYPEYAEFARKLLGTLYTRMTNRPPPRPRQQTAEANEQRDAVKPQRTVTPTKQEVKRAEEVKPQRTVTPTKPQQEVKRTEEVKPQRTITPKTTKPQQEVKRTEEVRKEQKPSRAEAISERMSQFESRMSRSKLNEAMQLIFMEIETKKIEPTQVYKYTATRLRELSTDPRFQGT